MSGFADAFRARYERDARVFYALGRVNLIGEHTDYNDGWVMPCALDRYTWAGFAPREDREVRIYSELEQASIQFSLDALEPEPDHQWFRYIQGVAWALESAGHQLPGADILIRSTVPVGGGLSSSAALEVSVAYGWMSVAGHSIDRVQLAQLCQKAEHVYVGARVGIMDQYVAANAVVGSALLLDCRELRHRAVALPDTLSVVVANTMEKHQLSGSEYNVRREQCEEGVRRLQARIPYIHALRDVTPADLEEHKEVFDDEEVVYRRCRHVVTEIKRTLEAADALERGDAKRMGELMWASHESLRDDYEVTSKGLDLMVEIARLTPGVYGSRMTGGGFGGCTVTLVDKANETRVADSLRGHYQRETGLEPSVFAFRPGSGAAKAL